MVTVKRITWISEAALEAVITISDGCYELECFSQPCNFKVNQIVEECIYCFNNIGIVKSLDDKCYVHKHQGTFAYEMAGCLEDRSNGLIRIGAFVIKLEDGTLPGDLKDGDYIEFSMRRLEIY